MTTFISNAQNNIDLLNKPIFTKWDQLNLHFKIGFGGKISEGTPLSPLTFYECKSYIEKCAPSGWPIISGISKGTIILESNAIFVANVSQYDGLPVDTIKANLAQNNEITNDKTFITIEGNSLYMYDQNLIIPTGTIIVANNLFLWGRKFTNCTILIQKEGILETPLKIDKKKDAINKTVVPIDNSDLFLGTIDYFIIGVGDKCRISLKEYPANLFYLTVDEAIKFGFVEKVEGSIKSKVEAGIKIKINVKDSKIRSLEKM
jgi:hypothetical protein